MKKEQLILLLKNYKENKAKLKLRLRERQHILQKIENLKDVSLSATRYEENGNIHSKNKMTDKVGTIVSEHLEIEADLKIELEKVENEVEELNIKLEEVDIRLESLKTKEKEVLVAYYIEGNSYEYIGNITYYNLFEQTRTVDCIKKIIANSLEKIAKL